MAQTGTEPTIRVTDPARCSLCGGANDCAQADCAAQPAAPCWCVGRRFPAALLERASARDGGAACVCRRCLAAAEDEAEARAEAGSEGRAVVAAADARESR